MIPLWVIPYFVLVAALVLYGIHVQSKVEQLRSDSVKKKREEGDQPPTTGQAEETRLKRSPGAVAYKVAAAVVLVGITFVASVPGLFRSRFDRAVATVAERRAAERRVDEERLLETYRKTIKEQFALMAQTSSTQRMVSKPREVVYLECIVEAQENGKSLEEAKKSCLTLDFWAPSSPSPTPKK